MSGVVFCQVNTESMRNSNDGTGITNSIGFDFGFEKSNQEVFEVAGKYRLDYISKNGSHSFFVINYDNGSEKEEDQKNSNVLLGTGLVNFENVFYALRDIQYDGPFTFETTRGSSPLNTAKYNINFVFYCFILRG